MCLGREYRRIEIQIEKALPKCVDLLHYSLIAFFEPMHRLSIKLAVGRETFLRMGSGGGGRGGKQWNFLQPNGLA